MAEQIKAWCISMLKDRLGWGLHKCLACQFGVRQADKWQGSWGDGVKHVAGQIGW